MKKVLSVLLILAAVMLAGCSTSNSSSKISSQDIKNKYDKSAGFSATANLSVEKPVKSSMFSLSADYKKDSAINYTVISPSFMKGLKLDSNDTSAIIDYIGKKFSIPKEAANVPVSMFFKIPSILKYACDMAAVSMNKDSSGLLYVEFLQDDINFKVYFDEKAQTPSKIIFGDKMGLFGGSVTFENFSYK